jgi:hypothetical protein
MKTTKQFNRQLVTEYVENREDLCYTKTVACLKLFEENSSPGDRCSSNNCHWKNSGKIIQINNVTGVRNLNIINNNDLKNKKRVKHNKSNIIEWFNLT